MSAGGWAQEKLAAEARRAVVFVEANGDGFMVGRRLADRVSFAQVRFTRAELLELAIRACASLGVDAQISNLAGSR